jgi:hypothetical protein
MMIPPGDFCSADEPPLPPELANLSPAALAVALATRQLIDELIGDMGMPAGDATDPEPST